MGSGNVQGLEVVPLVLDLGSLGHTEPQPAHYILELFDGLGDRMQMAQHGSRAGYCGVEIDRLLCGDGTGQPLGGLLQGGLDLLLHFVETLAGHRFVGLGDLAKSLLHGAK